MLAFDENAASAYSALEPQRQQLAKMDARIAAIALSQQLILLTRNYRDFSKVVGLTIEDWTVSS
ncbi:type II toxin-antitoxin system VapC family toxin [Acaryochloris sp. CCMEE 5410]|uniref:type II toxin-antitoxin system VapC family toxin n=1 Tax=Acaryochloris sp. CCMEE 5410 TaxID=310037 RepID=UPI0002484DF2|nr:type II toxin-antitoxin system VapC family toxin [Acaryochloris sp. CCMEE 5410]KAI9134829.1 type II toxin-antitoxin system VapC family toxin [Acaryochloris sp. CCMEE 5410]